MIPIIMVVVSFFGILSAIMCWDRLFEFTVILLFFFIGGGVLFLFYGMWMNALGYW